MDHQLNFIATFFFSNQRVWAYLGVFFKDKHAHNEIGTSSLGHQLFRILINNHKPIHSIPRAALLISG